MIKVFIDGREGTTGLKIDERLRDRNDVKVIVLPDDLRKDVSARKEAIASSDVTFLCLPDAAAVEAVSLAADSGTVIIDASTAHRTAEGLRSFQKITVKTSRTAGVSQTPAVTQADLLRLYIP